MIREMNDETARRLVDLNRRFYARHAASFNASRERPWQGWERLLEYLQPPRARPLAVLDVGCGNARFASFLAARRDAPLSYLGVDVSSELLAAARQRLAGLPARVEAEVRELDLSTGDPGTALEGQRFDLVALFGVLHHLPGIRRRGTLLRQLGELLVPGGALAATLWQFDQQPRFASKLLEWEEYNLVAAEKIDLAELEPGDHLLTWGGDRTTPRYCHLADEAEEEALTTASRLEPLARFAADGPGGSDNVYLLLSRAPSSPTRGGSEASSTRSISKAARR